VVLAEEKNLTGRFFGEVEGAVMDSLRTGDAVFKKVSIFDYQGLCLDDKNRTSNSDANFIFTVSSVVKLRN
jgi:voltage-dependent calcium channel alpha-2/delta-4